jgi:hypothetical protein
VADVEVEVAGAAAPLRREEEETTARPDRHLPLVAARVDRLAEIFGRRPRPAGRARAVDVKAAPPAFPVRREVERAVGRERRRLFVGARVDRAAQTFRAAPTAAPAPLNHPEVEIRFRVRPLGRTVGAEVELRAVGRDERVFVLIAARKGRDPRLAPTAFGPPREDDDGQLAPPDALHEVEGLAVGSERAAALVEARRDDAFAEEFRPLRGLLRGGRRRARQAAQGGGQIERQARAPLTRRPPHLVPPTSSTPAARASIW